VNTKLLEKYAASIFRFQKCREKNWLSCKGSLQGRRSPRPKGGVRKRRPRQTSAKLGKRMALLSGTVTFFVKAGSGIVKKDGSF
jgi:hypothetical protein